MTDQTPAEPLSADEQDSMRRVMDGDPSYRDLLYTTGEQNLIRAFFATIDALATRESAEAGLDVERVRRALLAAVTELPQPTLGLAGGVNRGAVVDAINRVCLAAAHPQDPPETTRCGCTADAELGAGSVCPACGHRDHGLSGCQAAPR